MSSSLPSQHQAQIVLPSADLSADMDFLIELGFRLQNIFPDDDPAVAVMVGHGQQIRLDKEFQGAATTILLLTDDEQLLQSELTQWTAPNGSVFKLQSRSYQMITPPTRHQFEARQLRDREPWVIGRAGMLYRDLVPSRLGGGIMASHIRIPVGGPVPDMVHYHTIGFQLIYCYRGWVRLVYDDQGPEFILKAGDCVTQPPEIRHRVLEASDNLEVIEIGVPAEHMTTIDHEMTLPTDNFWPEREFQGQKFCRHEAGEASWKNWRVPSFEHRETGVSQATAGVASVQVIRPIGTIEESVSQKHQADILFTFVLSGSMSLQVDKHGSHHLQSGDAFVIPPYESYRFTECASDLELLEVALPGI